MGPSRCWYCGPLAALRETFSLRRSQSYSKWPKSLWIRRHHLAPRPISNPKPGGAAAPGKLQTCLPWCCSCAPLCPPASSAGPSHGSSLSSVTEPGLPLPDSSQVTTAPFLPRSRRSHLKGELSPPLITQDREGHCSYLEGIAGLGDL